MKRFARLFGTAVGLLVLLAGCSSDDAAEAQDRSWAPLDGLETTTVWFTFFDQKGEVWAATGAGLHRWSKPRAEGLSGWDPVIPSGNVMAADSDPTSDAMWVATDSALYRVAADGTATKASDLTGATVRVGQTGGMAVGGDGRVFVVAVGFMNLWAFTPSTSTWEQITIDPSVSPTSVAMMRITRGPSGDIWTGLPLHLFRVPKGGKQATVVTPCLSKAENCPTLSRSTDGKLYAEVKNDVTNYHGMWRFDEATGKVTDELARLPKDYVQSNGAAVDTNDTVYLSGRTTMDESADAALFIARPGQEPTKISTFPHRAWNYVVRNGRVVGGEANSGVWQLQ
jgi:ligand-binding sensor domain-containing protein